MPNILKLEKIHFEETALKLGKIVCHRMIYNVVRSIKNF